MLAEDWESLYQPEPLSQQIADTWAAVEQRKVDRLQREQAITEALGKMDGQIKQWRARVTTRNRQAESERLRREQVRAIFATIIFFCSVAEPVELELNETLSRNYLFNNNLFWSVLMDKKPPLRCTVGISYDTVILL